MGKGLGQEQMEALSLLLASGGALTVGGLLMGFDKATAEPGTREYNVAYAGLSRSLKGLRERGLLKIYKGVSVAGHAARVAALTAEGARQAREIQQWEEGEEES